MYLLIVFVFFTLSFYFKLIDHDELIILKNEEEEKENYEDIEHEIFSDEVKQEEIFFFEINKRIFFLNNLIWFDLKQKKKQNFGLRLQDLQAEKDKLLVETADMLRCNISMAEILLKKHCMKFLLLLLVCVCGVYNH